MKWVWLAGWLIAWATIITLAVWAWRTAADIGEDIINRKDIL